MNRKGFIGGSDVVRLQDHSKWHEIWEVKTGRKRPVDLSDNLAVQMGVNTENFNIEWFFKMMGDAVKLNRSLKQHTFSKNYKGVLLKGTVDLANSIEKYIVECKHTFEANSMYRVRELYMPQVQTYMFLSNIKKCYLSVFFGNNKYDCLEIEYHQEYFEKIMERVVQFWSYVKEDQAPPMEETKLKPVPTDNIVIDGKISKNMAGNNWWTNIVDQYIELKPSHDTFETVKKEILNTLESNQRSVYCDRLEVVRSKSGRRNINLINNKEDVA